MDVQQQLLILEQRYDDYLNDITEIQIKLELVESKLFKCQEEIRQLKAVLDSKSIKMKQ